MTRPSSTFVTAFLAIALTAGCGTQNSVTKPTSTAGPPSQQADRASIEALIASQPEFDVTFTDDEGELLGSATAASPTTGGQNVAATDSGDVGATRPVSWGRLRRPSDHPPVRTIEFLTPPESLRALVRVNVKFDGKFFVDRTDDGIRNPGNKPLRDQLTRYALFKKIWFRPDSTGDDSLFGWRLIAISPTAFTMIDPAAQTVNITSVKFTGGTSLITITDPADLLSLRRREHPLPLFKAGEEVKVEAAVTNTDTGYDPPSFVFLHVPISGAICPGPRERVRIRMYDNGRNGDTVAGDGIYTAMWTVRDWGRHYATVDVLNSRTLQNETDDDYNSTEWGIPYVSYPSWMP